MKQDTVIIRRYGNRRLYDTSASRYVNLDQVAAMIRQGTDVQVVDATTGEDRTRGVLTQIITEEAKGQPSGLPIELLRQLILASDYARQEFLMWYLRTAFDTYQKVQESFQNRLADMGSAALAPLQKMRSFISSALSPEGPPEPPSEIEQLRQRIAELEAMLKANAAQSPRKRKSAPPPER